MKPCAIYRFEEHNFIVEGEGQDLLELANRLKDAEGTLGDLRFQITEFFQGDGDE